MRSLDPKLLLAGLARTRPIFHSEADFQHALSMLIARQHPDSRLRLETRPTRGVHLDIQVDEDGQRSAIELKYLVRAFEGEHDGERFELPNRGAHDISRYDVVKDIARVELLLRDGYVQRGWVIVLASDSAYWRPGHKSDPIDLSFRIHEGARLVGERSWGELAGAGTRRQRELALRLAGSYDCRWAPYSVITDTSGRSHDLRYLAIQVHQDNLAGS
jgi:hypothetical protein